MTNEYIEPVTVSTFHTIEDEYIELQVQGHIVWEMVRCGKIQHECGFEHTSTNVDRVYRVLDNGHFLPFDWENATSMNIHTREHEQLELFLQEDIRENSGVEE